MSDEQRAAIGVHHTGTTDQSWNGPAAVAGAPNDAAVLRHMHAWFETGADPEKKGSWKLPHHAGRAGSAANMAGVRNALSRLPQADIPESDRAGVERHLRAHMSDAENASAPAGRLTPQHETRRGLAEVRQVDENDGVRSVTLHCITPGVVDDYGSVWAPDTFDASLEARLPTLVWAHDWTEPLGRGVDYRIGDDGPDVIFEFDSFADVPRARQAYAQVRSGTIRDCSVGFCNTQRRDPTDEEREQWPGVREVIERADLDEVSLVLSGAVPGAKVLALRSANSGTVTEDTVIALARKVAAGDLTHTEAKAALSLYADTGLVVPAGEVSDIDVTFGEDHTATEAAVDHTATDLSIDVALDGFGRSRW